MSNQKILVVEDVAIARKLTALTLEKLGYTVDTANNGETAITLATKNEYHLILMDLGLPDVSGIEAAKSIREKENTKKVPIVALTAHADENYKAQCFQAEMNGFFTKPMGLDMAKAIVRKFLGPTPLLD